jgi:hypothetical protein
MTRALRWVLCDKLCIFWHMWDKGSIIGARYNKTGTRASIASGVDNPAD